MPFDFIDLGHVNYEWDDFCTTDTVWDPMQAMCRVDRCGSWHNNMMTSSKETFSAFTSPLWGEFTGPRWIPRTKASDADFDVSFDRCRNKRLNEQQIGGDLDAITPIMTSL